MKIIYKLAYFFSIQTGHISMAQQPPVVCCDYITGQHSSKALGFLFR